MGPDVVCNCKRTNSVVSCSGSMWADVSCLGSPNSGRPHTEFQVSSRHSVLCLHLCDAYMLLQNLANTRARTTITSIITVLLRRLLFTHRKAIISLQKIHNLSKVVSKAQSHVYTNNRTPSLRGNTGSS
jgi:hypothetical protein